MAKKKSPIKLGLLIIAIAVSGFVIVDAYGCSLKDGVDMSTVNQNDFLYGDFLPIFCDLTDFTDRDAIEVDTEDYEIGDTVNLDGLDGFMIPFDDPIDEVVVEDPDGEMLQDDPEDVLIDMDQLDDLEMLGNETGTNDPIIGDDVTEILPPVEEPEEINEISEFVLISKVTKIFTDGTEEVITNEFEFIPFELFVEDTSNKDFSQGRFLAELFVRSDPNTFVEGSGLFDVFLNNMTINQMPTNIEFSGITDESGMLRVKFLSPTGIESDTFLLNVEPLTMQIQVNGITPLEFKITSIVGKVFDIDYSVSDATIFTFDFFRSVEQILVVDSQGNEVRAFPTDDRIRIGALDGSVKLSKCYKHTRYACWMFSTYGSSLGSPTIASVEIRNTATGELLFQNLAPFTKVYAIDGFITRNDTFTVNYGKVTSPYGSLPAGTFTFTTPENQKEFRYYCTHTGSSIGSHWGSSPDASSFKLVCNFPSG